MSLTDCSDDFSNIRQPAQIAGLDYPIPLGLVRVGSFVTSFQFGNTFEIVYADGTKGPSLYWNCTEMTKPNMLIGFEFRIGPRHGTKGDNYVNVKFPRCQNPNGQRGNYIAALKWKSDGTNTEGVIASEWSNSPPVYQDYNLDDPNPTIGNIKDGQWHGFLAACYNDSAGNVVIKQWYNPTATGWFGDYVFIGSAKDINGDIAPAPKLPYASLRNTGGTNPMQIRIDEIPSNDGVSALYIFPAANFELQNMFTCEIKEGSVAAAAATCVTTCPPGQHFDSVMQTCVLDSGPPPNTQPFTLTFPANGIVHGAMVDADGQENITSSMITTFNGLAQKNIGIGYFSQRWSAGITFPSSQCNACKSNGCVPFIRMQPSDDFDGAPGASTTITHAHVIAGQFDSQLTAYANAAKNFGTLILCEYGVEVNGDWFSWSDEGPTAYKNAYKHVVDIFRAQGANNVKWALHVDATDNGNGSQWYPGDSYIDIIGTSCYGAPPQGGCAEQLAACFNTFKNISTTKPLGIFEWGLGSPTDTSSALNAVATNSTYSRIKTMQRWHEHVIPGHEEDAVPDSTINVTTAELNAYKAGIANAKYTSTPPSISNAITNPPPTNNPPVGNSGNDKFGVRKIYPDKSGGFFKETTGGGDLEEHGDFRREWEIGTTTYTAIEITAHFKVHIQREDTISIKPKGSKHTGSEPMYPACCNIHYVPFSGTGKYIGKQCPHLNYKELPSNKASPKFSLGNIRDKWIGVKAIEWNEGSNVHWQTWIDPLANNSWKLWIDFLETNCSIGDDSDTCPPFTSAPAYTGSGSLPPTILMRVDFPNSSDDVEARYISAREITVSSALTASEPSDATAGIATYTQDGIVLPSLPTTSHAYEAPIYLNNYDHKANGSFREHFIKEEHDLNSVVVGGYVLVDGPDDEEISAQLGGGKHTPSNGGKSARCYEININLLGNIVRVYKENPHTIMNDTRIINYMNLGPRQGHYTGVMFMKVNINQIGKDCVRLLAWVDTEGMDDQGVLTPSKQNWVNILDEVDTGHWHDIPYLTGSVPGDSVATIRVDQQEEQSYHFKCGFAARIRGGPANF